MEEKEVTEREEPQDKQQEAEQAIVVEDANESDAVGRRGEDGQKGRNPSSGRW